MRYMIALAITGLCVGTISLWAHYAGAAVRQRIHQRLRAEQAAGQIPPEVDLTSGEVTDIGLELPDSDKFVVSLLDAWFGLRIFLIPLIAMACLVTAHYWPSKQTSGPPPGPVQT